jgi:rhodanese-related sulfurtransferase
VDILEDAGLDNAVHMDGGMVAWRHAGHEVEN